MEEYLSVDDLCGRLSMKKSYLYELTHTEKIPYIKMGRHLRFKWSSVMNWLNKKEKNSVKAYPTLFKRSQKEGHICRA